MDGKAGDGIYAVTLPAQTNGAIVEFYISAIDGAGHQRFWPAPVNADGVLTNSANAVFQVDDQIYSGAQPLYKLILTAKALAELRQINANTPAAPYPNDRSVVEPCGGQWHLYQHGREWHPGSIYGRLAQSWRWKP